MRRTSRTGPRSVSCLALAGGLVAFSSVAALAQMPSPPPQAGQEQREAPGQHNQHGQDGQMPMQGGNAPMHGNMHDMMRGMHGGGMHGGTAMPRAGQTPPPADQSVSSLAFRAVNDKMHRDMAIALQGDPDRDFAELMIAHHQGAIDMAKVAVAFGKNPEIRQLAEEIIAAQEREIAFLREWLEKNSGN